MLTIYLALLILDSTHAMHTRVTCATPAADDAPVCRFQAPKGTPAHTQARLVTSAGDFTITDWDKRTCVRPR